MHPSCDYLEQSPTSLAMTQRGRRVSNHCREQWLTHLSAARRVDGKDVIHHVIAWSNHQHR